jgi:hypothetical protein
MHLPRHKRSGLAAIVVEVLLIGVVLIASVLVAGFTFGIFSFYITPAVVSVAGTMCSATENTTTCQLTIINEGERPTATTGTCSIDESSDIGGSVIGGGTVPAGGSLQGVQCVAHGGELPSGSQVSGALPMTNGAILYFIGTLQ